MRHTASLFILLAILIGCGLQRPAPVLLRGEKFYGKRDLEYTREYNLIRNDVKSSIRKKSRKVVTNEVYSNDPQNLEINKVNCDFVMPVKGTIIPTTSSDEVCKDGVKIAAQGGTSVVASAHGKVIYIGKGLRWYGNLIIVEHEDNYMTMYSYLKSIHTKIGDEVKQGQVIGSAGKSSTQDKDPQMCFTIRHNGQAVDPFKYINCG